MKEQRQLLGRGERRGRSEPGRGTPQPWPLGHLSLFPPTCPQTRSLGWGLESCGRCLVRLLPPSPRAQPGQSPQPARRGPAPSSRAPGRKHYLIQCGRGEASLNQPWIDFCFDHHKIVSVFCHPERTLVTHGLKQCPIVVARRLPVEWAVPTARGQAPWALAQAGAGRGRGPGCWREGRGLSCTKAGAGLLHLAGSVSKDSTTFF